MPINPISSYRHVETAQTLGTNQPVSSDHSNHERKQIPETELAQKVSSEDVRSERNASILQAHLDLSLSSKNEPQALLFKTALEALREALESTLGPKAIDNAYESGLDVSPDATANRIVSLSTGFFSLYQEQHPELSENEQLDNFLEIIGGGIEKGFTEAREILDGLGVLDELDIADNIDKTYELVLLGLSDFREEREAQVVATNNVPD